MALGVVALTLVSAAFTPAWISSRSSLTSASKVRTAHVRAMGPMELELFVGVLGAIGAIGAATSTSVPMGEDAVNTTIAPRRTKSEVRMFEEKISRLKRDGATVIAHRVAIAAASAERVRQELATPMKMSGTVVPVGANYAAASDVVVPVGAMTKSEDQTDLDDRITPVSRPADEARDISTSRGRAVIFPLFPTSKRDDHW